MSSSLGATVKDIRESSMQNSMRNKGFNTLDVSYNFKLADIIYRFLTGKDNRLPSYEYVDKVVAKQLEGRKSRKEKGRGVIVALGCGMCIYYERNDTTCNLTVEHETILKPSKSRFDVISEDQHEAFIHTVLGFNSVTTEPVDPEAEPIFSPNRVKILMEYLKAYSLMHTDTKKKVGK